jgi:cation transport ATPase
MWFFFSLKGTDVAIASADMILMKNDLRDVVVALEVARSTYNRIRINFFWAFLYNLCGVPLAAGLLYPIIKPIVVPPAIAGLAMALSSVTVVLSSLSLKLWKGIVFFFVFFFFKTQKSACDQNCVSSESNRFGCFFHRHGG